MFDHHCLQKIRVEEKERSGILELRHLRLKKIPDELLKLSHLKTLDLRYNELIDISSLKYLVDLECLILSKNQIEDITSLEKLSNLRVLDLSSNLIEKTKPLEELQNLQTLLLGDNKIKEIKSLSTLHNLQILDLGFNLLKEIDAVKELKNLEELYLPKNKIRNFNIISALTHLQTLNLSSNQISDLSFLIHLGKLQNLDLSENKINDISEIVNLSNLKNLDLSNNNISNIQFLEKLVKIQNVNLSDNLINDISSFRLTVQQPLYLNLNLAGNRIEDLSPILPLIEQGVQIKWYYSAKGICVKDNPLKGPPLEIVEQGNEVILKYFQDRQKQGIDYLYEAKLLIVGEGESGKTTLAWKLRDINSKMPKKSDDRTKGIDIQSLKIPNQTDEHRPFYMNVWDFGGQEIYHATHQFFLTKRSLYLIVNNTRSNLTDFYHWVQTINLFSNNSPIIIVQNEVAGSVTDFDLRGIQQYFDNVLGVKEADLSNITDGRVDKLIREIHFRIQLLDHVGMEFPKQWVAIRKALEVQAKRMPYISNVDFYSICEENQIIEKEAMHRIGNIFHDLGVLLFFQDDPILKKLIILQNTWATKGVYIILDNDKIRHQKGQFSINDAEDIWENTPFENKEAELLQLMMKFELCYQITYNTPSLYVAPQLLPLEKPEYKWNNKKNLIISYKYEFMPKGLLGRLIVRLHRYIKDIDRCAWRSGCIFSYKNTEAQVIETYGLKQIEIRINGNHRSQIATVVTKEIDELNSSFEHIKVYKLIPCNCKECKKRDKPHFFDYNNLMNRKERRKKTIECDISFEDVKVEEILDGAFDNIEGWKISIPVLLKNDKIEEAIEILENSHPKEAILLQQRLCTGHKYFVLGLLSMGDWVIIRQQVSYGILSIYESSTHENLGFSSSIDRINTQLNKIELMLSDHDQLLNRIIEQNDSHQDEILMVLQEFTAHPPDDAYVEELVAVVERGMANLQAKIPPSSEIVQNWLEAGKQLRLAPDSKAKLKWTIPFLFLKLEKEISWNGGDWFNAIREDVKRGVKGNWKEIFVEEH